MSPDLIVHSLSKPQIKAALDASIQSGSMDAFYGVVDMSRKSRTYFVQYKHQLHSLKAVVTFAAKQVDANFRSDDFQSAQGARRLRELGFQVEHNLNDADNNREKKWIEVLERPQQVKFRERLIDFYGKCVLTDCSTLRALEAAHVIPVSDKGGDTQSNGILLRADLHKLFDADLLAINPADGSVCLASSCETDYHELLSGKVFEAPKGGPGLGAFQKRWARFEAAKTIT